ncbi:MAG: penicillin acylase family protein [Pseudomonadota bacterium]
MKKIIGAIVGLTMVILLGGALYLHAPVNASFDRKGALAAAAQYEARLIRDQFGVPHIYGASDADVAFGLAYAHAQDDWATIEDVLFFSRGELARRKGRDAAVADYLVAALGVNELIAEKYQTDLSAETRALVEAYASGINLWCAEKRSRCSAGAAPVSGQDIIAGFVSRTPFFYGLDDQLRKLFDGNLETQASIDAARYAILKLRPGQTTGSNAMAVAPSRSADGHTRLMVNSHQPYTGPVAWYEARVKSEEGWDMIGGLFPGAPMILVGAGPELGWAHTVNKPDIIDFYKLEVDNPKDPTRYRFDGEWMMLDRRTVKFRVKLFGAFSLPVSREIYRSVHGPVFVTDEGVFAMAYGGAGDIRAAEQWYRMNKSKTYTQWHDAMDMGAIPSFNAVYADKTGTIAYFYNAAIPVRDEAYDWSGVLAGDTSETLWKGRRPFSVVPQVVNPESGYVVNANHTPFKASGDNDNPVADNFPDHFGISQNTTNRGFRIQELYGSDASITEEEFIAYKMDREYSKQSRVIDTVERAIEAHVSGDPLMDDAIAALKAWDHTADRDSRGAALAILTAQKSRGYYIDADTADDANILSALRETATALKRHFGRVDPEWRNVARFKRGDNIDEEIDGGPDALRAVWLEPDIENGALTAIGGDTYILYADWTPTGDVDFWTIHQFGAATLDKRSPHYDDQAPLFLQEEWRKPPMTLEALLKEAIRDDTIGPAP